jgi:hypothetical protein
VRYQMASTTKIPTMKIVKAMMPNLVCMSLPPC